MEKDLTARYYAYVAVLYFTGNAYILGSDSAAGRNSWLMLLADAVLYVPVICMYGSLASKYPGESFFEICGKLLGRSVASIAAVLYILYGIAVFSMSMSCLSRFTAANILPETPKLLMAATVEVCVVLSVCSGEGNMGKWAAFIMPVVFSVMLLSLLISIPSLNMSHILPIAYPTEDTLAGIYRYSAFPFGEPIAMLSLLQSVKGGIRTRHLLVPWLTASVMLTLTFMKNTMVLGGALSGQVGFASFQADSVSGYNSLGQRIEALTSMVPAVSSILEAAVMLMFMLCAVRYLTGTTGKALWSVLFSAVGVTVCTLMYTNNIQLEKRAVLWPLISVPLQLLPPFAAWTVCIVRRRILQKSLEKNLNVVYNDKQR